MPSHIHRTHGGTAQCVRWFLKKKKALLDVVLQRTPLKALKQELESSQEHGGCLASVRPLSFVLKAGTERPAVSRWFGWWGPESDVTSCPFAPAPGHSALPAPLMSSCREQKVKLLEAK